MKRMTCREMGGMCDEAIIAASTDEMMMKGMVHLEAAHPQMAADIKAMPKDDPAMVAWSEKFMKDFEVAPEVE